MNINSSQMIMQLAEAGIVSPTWSISDGSYAMPTLQWVTGPFSDALRKLQYEFKVSGWTREDNDCDDFARLSAAFAQVLHHNTPDRPEGTALAVGELWYLQDAGGGHAINFAVCGPDKTDVLFYEPQRVALVQLTESERARTLLIRC
tara:strand:- start:1405 stop:1845 length:441 start_codon:yes stop_codon:yes gene_type:complete